MSVIRDYQAARHPERSAEPEQVHLARQTRNLVLAIAVMAVLVLLFAPIW